ncbi:hypothetical protein TNCV_185471 [Trichonephila clavipes]|nr:hypothetical protein TNCV_185471 [Trichonephila clavipes]
MNSNIPEFLDLVVVVVLPFPSDTPPEGRLSFDRFYLHQLPLHGWSSAVPGSNSSPACHESVILTTRPTVHDDFKQARLIKLRKGGFSFSCITEREGIYPQDRIVGSSAPGKLLFQEDSDSTTHRSPLTKKTAVFATWLWNIVGALKTGIIAFVGNRQTL